MLLSRLSWLVTQIINGQVGGPDCLISAARTGWNAWFRHTESLEQSTCSKNLTWTTPDPSPKGVSSIMWRDLGSKDGLRGHIWWLKTSTGRRGESGLERGSDGLQKPGSEYIFSDECQIVIGNNNKLYIWRTDDEKDRPHHVCLPKVKKLSLVVSPAGGRTHWRDWWHCELIQVCQDTSGPPIADHRVVLWGWTVHLHAGQRQASHLYTRGKLDQMNLRVTEWPPQSPDINIIENLWKVLKKRLQPVLSSISSKEELFQAVANVWYSITQDDILGLYLSIPRRLKEVLKMKGHMGKY